MTLDEIECIEDYLIDKYYPNGFPTTSSPTPEPSLVTLAPTNSPTQLPIAAPGIVYYTAL